MCVTHIDELFHLPKQNRSMWCRLIFAAVAAALATAAPASKQDSLLEGTPVLPDVLATLIAAYKPLLGNYAKSQLPATIGNCGQDNPPLPCSESGNLYETTNTFYKVRARWISGINTMTLNSLNATFDDSGNMALTLAVNFAQLPMSLKVDGCGGFLGCVNVLDNSDSCCGSNKTVVMTATANCSESYPFITGFAVATTKITPAINVQIDILGKMFDVRDVTPSIESGLKDAAGNFLAAKGVDLLNTEIKSLFGDKIYCSQKSKNAQTPAPTTTTVAPTPSPTNATTTTAPSSTSTSVDGSTPASTSSSTASTTTVAPKSSAASFYHGWTLLVGAVVALFLN
ncbi:hypothetical protein AeMF1_017792 [Aphanomyces euteiches]|nr:hypothetical protein AeMF1_017792 [Aphanomyces euteiches]KAH9196018.1 hypothetical protein AeNC1_002002 [Aphanomyces euteiches]